MLFLKLVKVPRCGSVSSGGWREPQSQEHSGTHTSAAGKPDLSEKYQHQFLSSNCTVESKNDSVESVPCWNSGSHWWACKASAFTCNEPPCWLSFPCTSNAHGYMCMTYVCGKHVSHAACVEVSISAEHSGVVTSATVSTVAVPHCCLLLS